MRDVRRTAFREAGFTEAQTNALVMALEPLATKEDLRSFSEALRGDLGTLRGDLEALRSDVAVLRNDFRWMKWVGGAIGVAVLTEMVSGFFT